LSWSDEISLVPLPSKKPCIMVLWHNPEKEYHKKCFTDIDEQTARECLDDLLNHRLMNLLEEKKDYGIHGRAGKWEQMGRNEQEKNFTLHLAIDLIVPRIYPHWIQIFYDARLVDKVTNENIQKIKNTKRFLDSDTFKTLVIKFPTQNIDDQNTLKIILLDSIMQTISEAKNLNIDDHEWGVYVKQNDTEGGCFITPYILLPYGKAWKSKLKDKFPAAQIRVFDNYFEQVRNFICSAEIKTSNRRNKSNNKKRTYKKNPRMVSAARFTKP
jgi:hypothetical protein